MSAATPLPRENLYDEIDHLRAQMDDIYGSHDPQAWVEILFELRTVRDSVPLTTHREELTRLIERGRAKVQEFESGLIHRVKKMMPFDTGADRHDRWVLIDLRELVKDALAVAEHAVNAIEYHEEPVPEGQEPHSQYS